MEQKVFILDSLEKIEQFSRGESPYQRSAELLKEDAILPQLFVADASGNPRVNPLKIRELIDRVKDRTVTDYDGKIAQFENQTKIRSKFFVSDDINRNLGYLGYPCLKANFEVFGKQEISKYPIILIIAEVDNNGTIFQLGGDFKINYDRAPTDTDPNKFFVPFEDVQVTGKYEIPSKLDEILAVATSDYTDPNCVPKKNYKFYGNDQDWGIVGLNQKLVKSVTVENRGDQRLVIAKYRMSNDMDTHFKVVNLNTPVTIEAGASLSFDVEYSAGDEPEVPHTNDIIYAVYHDEFPFVNQVLEDKLNSKLTGKSGERDLIDDIEDDLGDWLEGDDNGTYVIKTISRIVDKSAPIEKWNTNGLWECAGEKLNTFFTGSNGQTNDAHYLSVYNKLSGSKGSFHQFDISFGHKDGLGSRYIVSGLDSKPSKVMFKKYLQQCYEPEPNLHSSKPTKFKFKNGVNGNYAYFIQTNRDDFKDMLDPGNFELCLSPLSGSSNQLINTGSNVQVDQTATSFYTLIDESFDTKQKQSDERNLKDWYYITSGSLRDGIYDEETDNAWGVVFPKLGLIVLDGVVLDQSCSFNTVTASIDGQNSQKLFLSISGSSSLTNSRNYTGSFFARSAERKVVETYFCRVNGNEFNHSTNPTYTTGSYNDIKYTYFKDDPHSYITTIGLYNRKGVLLAVGKLKRPILKHQNKSYVFQVRVRMN